jgi:hypothetical protein
MGDLFLSFTMIKMKAKPATQDKEEGCYDENCDLDEGSKSQFSNKHKLVEHQQRDILVNCSSIKLAGSKFVNLMQLVTLMLISCRN